MLTYLHSGTKMCKLYVVLSERARLLGSLRTLCAPLQYANWNFGSNVRFYPPFHETTRHLADRGSRTESMATKVPLPYLAGPASNEILSSDDILSLAAVPTR